MAQFNIETNIGETTGLFSQFGGVLGNLPGLWARATAALRIFTAALVSNPIGLILVAVAGAISLAASALSRFQPAVDLLDRGLAALSATWAFVNDEILEFLGLIEDTNGSLRDNIAAAIEAEAATQRLRDARIAFIETESRLNQQLQESRRTAQDQTETDEARVAALDNAQRVQNLIFAERIRQANVEAEIARLAASLATNDADANEELARANAAVTDAKAAHAAADASLIAMKTALILRIEAETLAENIQADARIEGNIQRGQQQQLDYLQLAGAGEDELDQLRLRFANAEQARTNLALFNALKFGATTEELRRLEIADLVAQDNVLAAIHNANISRLRVQQETEEEVTDASLGLASQVGNTLQQIAGENKGLAIAGLIVGQATAVASAIVDTVRANAAAVAASPLTAGQPFVAINTISAALGIASAVAATVQGISQINSAGGPAATGGGGGGGISAPAFGPQVSIPNTGPSQDPFQQQTGQLMQMMEQMQLMAVITPESGPGSLPAAQRSNTRRQNKTIFGS